ncbi:MAG: uncharacterized protein A8A55_0237 [Amphiamblys sp. WSBS2006]|nr:MAG: uncharacterized protein A8A55_0237 [Amphiamblys sp. WSBS2006]
MIAARERALVFLYRALCPGMKEIEGYIEELEILPREMGKVLTQIGTYDGMALGAESELEQRLAEVAKTGIFSHGEMETIKTLLAEMEKITEEKQELAKKALYTTQHHIQKIRSEINDIMTEPTILESTELFYEGESETASP